MHKWVYSWPAFLCATTIFWLSVIKTPIIKLADNWFLDNIDKLGHTIAYAGLCISGCWSFRKIYLGNKMLVQQIGKIAFFCFLYGIIIEIIQHFLPYRSFDPYDMFSNALGVSLGAVVFNRFFR